MTIPAGCFYYVECMEPSILIYCRWLTQESGLRSLYYVSRFHEESMHDTRFRYFIPRNMVLDKSWMRFVQDMANESYGSELNHALNFWGDEKNLHYGLKVPKMGEIEHEVKKGAFIQLLAVLANQYIIYRAFKVENFEWRWWGKLVAWCKGFGGITTYQAERDLTRTPKPGRPLGRGRVVQEAEHE
jgi:hypothetical protein